MTQWKIEPNNEGEPYIVAGDSPEAALLEVFREVGYAAEVVWLDAHGCLAYQDPEMRETLGDVEDWEIEEIETVVYLCANPEILRNACDPDNEAHPGAADFTIGEALDLAEDVASGLGIHLERVHTFHAWTDWCNRPPTAGDSVHRFTVARAGVGSKAAEAVSDAMYAVLTGGAS